MTPFGTVHGRPVEFTDHALARAAEMGLDHDTLRAILTRPDSITRSPKYAPALNYRRGGYTLGVTVEQDGTRTVTTCLYATGAGWQRAEQGGQLGDGREYRPGLVLAGAAS